MPKWAVSAPEAMKSGCSGLVDHRKTELLVEGPLRRQVAHIQHRCEPDEAVGC